MADFLAAECGIRQLMGRYADAVWRQDSAAFGQCWCEDAVWKIAGREAKGRAEIAAMFEASVAPSERVMLWAGIPVIELTPEGATGRVQVTELIKRRTGEGLRTLGLYYDHYREDNGQWRFARRHFNLYYVGPPDLSGEIYPDVLEYGPPPGMPGEGDPTSVKR
ncbi:MAG: nuclear transport factor 2 family protein [Rhizobiaceae bacterium]